LIRRGKGLKKSGVARIACTRKKTESVDPRRREEVAPRSKRRGRREGDAYPGKAWKERGRRRTLRVYVSDRSINVSDTGKGHHQHHPVTDSHRTEKEGTKGLQKSLKKGGGKEESSKSGRRIRGVPSYRPAARQVSRKVVAPSKITERREAREPNESKD